MAAMGKLFWRYMVNVMKSAQPSNKDGGAKWCPKPTMDIVLFGNLLTAEMLQILCHLRVIGLKTWPQNLVMFKRMIRKNSQRGANLKFCLGYREKKKRFPESWFTPSRKLFLKPMLQVVDLRLETLSLEMLLEFYGFLSISMDFYRFL